MTGLFAHSCQSVSSPDSLRSGKKAPVWFGQAVPHVLSIPSRAATQPPCLGAEAFPLWNVQSASPPAPLLHHAGPRTFHSVLASLRYF